MTQQFVHLHLHTEYSLVDSTIRVKPLLKTVAQAGMPAIAVTDQSNLFSMVKFYRAAIQQGVKPIIGVDAWIHNAEQPSQPFRMVFLCMNNQGYQNLTQLVSLGYTQGQHSGVPIIQPQWLEGKTEGLIALSGGVHGQVGRLLITENEKAAQSVLRQWLAWFPDRFYLELQRVGRAEEDDYNQAAVQLALHTGSCHQRCAIFKSGGFCSPRSPGVYTRRTHAGRSQTAKALYHTTILAQCR
jgi:DNA polymerase-3 subunit alpha